MSCVKGSPKTGGRKPGSPNLTTRAIREKLRPVLQAEIENIPDMLEKLDDETRLNMVIKLLPYLVPKVAPAAAIAVDNDGGPDLGEDLRRMAAGI